MAAPAAPPSEFLGGTTVQSGDGLVLRSETLSAVQNFLNAIAVFMLSPDFSAASLSGYLTDSDLRISSTADSFGPWLYAVNARFDVCMPGPCPDVDFEIVRVDKSGSRIISFAGAGYSRLSAPARYANAMTSKRLYIPPRLGATLLLHSPYWSVF
jgi:hypothetical protein